MQRGWRHLWTVEFCQEGDECGVYEVESMRGQGDAGKMAERLRYAMELRGITAAELSRRAGCHKSSISMYLQGEHAASRQSAEKISRILDVTPAWLLGYDVPMMEEEQQEIPTRAIDIGHKRFLQVGEVLVNLDHVVMISPCSGGVTVLLDTGSSVEGAIIE